MTERPLLGLILLTMTMLLNYQVTEQMESLRGTVGRQCLSSGKCKGKSLMCENNTSCRLKLNADCTEPYLRESCQTGTGCLILCPCCMDPIYTCQKTTSLYESCPLSLLLVFSALIGALVLTGLVFFVVLEKIGS